LLLGGVQQHGHCYKRAPVQQFQHESHIHKAPILNKLGDHPGLPVLFGMCMKGMPYRLIKQFYGDEVTCLAFRVQFEPVIIDFVKSVPISGVRGPKLFLEEWKRCYS